MKRRRRILLAALGGTISASVDEQGRYTPVRSGAELLDSVPGILELADVEAAEVARLPSHAVTPADMHDLARGVREWAGAGYDGVVVTHGTDTMEETAYALALQLDLEIPVVLTGAMRPGEEPGSDGPANLIAAVRVAASSEFAGLGPLVVMNDEVHGARRATKVHTSRVAAFASPSFGPLGYVVEDRAVLNTRPAARDYLGMPQTMDKRVELVWAAAGSDGLLVEASAAVADGIVVAGTGGGHAPKSMAESLERAVASGVPAVLASRCVSGPVLEGTYDGPGSETHLIGAGLLPAGDLSPLKARLRLLTALSLGLDPEEVFPV